jgi:hypothetical protein
MHISIKGNSWAPVIRGLQRALTSLASLTHCHRLTFVAWAPHLQANIHQHVYFLLINSI